MKMCNNKGLADVFKTVDCNNDKESTFYFNKDSILWYS